MTEPLATEETLFLRVTAFLRDFLTLSITGAITTLTAYYILQKLAEFVQ